MNLVFDLWSLIFVSLILRLFLPSAPRCLPTAPAVCLLLSAVRRLPPALFVFIQLAQVTKAVNARFVTIAPAEVDCIPPDEAQVVDDELFGD